MGSVLDLGRWAVQIVNEILSLTDLAGKRALVPIGDLSALEVETVLTESCIMTRRLGRDVRS